jgi:hypothetical protein
MQTCSGKTGIYYRLIPVKHDLTSEFVDRYSIVQIKLQNSYLPAGRQVNSKLSFPSLRSKKNCFCSEILPWTTINI